MFDLLAFMCLSVVISHIIIQSQSFNLKREVRPILYLKKKLYQNQCANINSISNSFVLIYSQINQALTLFY